MKEIKHTNPESPETSDDEYLEWVSGWLDRAEAYHAEHGNSPVFIGKANVRRLFNLANK